MNLLLSPAKIGGLELKNRVGMSPMCMYEVEAEDGVITPFHYAHYGARAIGQVGLVIIEATAVEPNGRITVNDLGLWNDEQRDALSILVNQLHSFDSKVGIQLAHAGRKAENVNQPLSASNILFSERYNTPKAMTTEDINTFINQFKSAALRAEQAGFDMVEIHGAHGYLINQFLEAAVNNRSDEYGGSLENRFRLLKEVVEAVKSVFNGAIWVRLSASAYLHETEQNSLEDWQTVALWLEQLEVDALDISTGGVVHTKPSIDIREGYQVPFAQAMKEATSLDVATVGLMQSPTLCEHVLKLNEADFILQGRALLRNPNWVAEAAEILEEDDFKYYNDSYKRGYSI